MGCDIHCYVEYRRPEGDPTDKFAWRDFGARINPGRDYQLFGRLAGVRCPPSSNTPPLRGIPDNLGFAARWDYWLAVKDDPKEVYDGACLRANAERWVFGKRSRYQTDTREHVSNPDWHSVTWLTPDEWAAAVKSVNPIGREEYRALLHAMRSLERDGFQVRVVIWFDN